MNETQQRKKRKKNKQNSLVCSRWASNLSKIEKLFESLECYSCNDTFQISNALNIVYFIDSSYAQSKYVNLIYIKKFYAKDEELFWERISFTVHHIH